MFTLPPLPPKDHVLRDVKQNVVSSQEFTPVGLPRITQANLGKFCAPIHYQDNEKLANLDFDKSPNPQLLERWTDNARAFWVDKPGKNDYFLHDMCKKYTVEVVPTYDARFKHKPERVFYRSFQYELECLEAERLKKLERKMERDERHEREKNKIIEEKNTRNTDTMGIKTCKDITPFWWKKSVGESENFGLREAIPRQNSKTVEAVCYDRTDFRWQEEPELTELVHTDPCRRRYDMALIGMPFRSQACNWYYSNYPPPDIRFVHKRFA